MLRSSELNRKYKIGSATKAAFQFHCDFERDLIFLLVFEEVSSRIEDARHLRIHHGYAEMMDFLIDVANFKTFTKTMKHESSQ